jgi:hypothetical protein
MIERYDPNKSYPQLDLMYDSNLSDLVDWNSSQSSKVYVDSYIYGILGRDGDLNRINQFINLEFNSVPSYDLSSFNLDENIELDFDGYNLILDENLVESKNNLIKLVNESETEDELINGVKDLFNLTESSTEETINPASTQLIRPTNLNSFISYVNPYLSDITNIVDSGIEVIMYNPISDFIDESTGLDTDLLTEIKSTFLNFGWNVELIQDGSIVKFKFNFK